MTLYFYSTSGTYGCFSNFSRHPFVYAAQLFPTAEHAFQTQKFLDRTLQEQIRKAPTPKEAARLGRQRSWPLRSDWDEVNLLAPA